MGAVAFIGHGNEMNAPRGRPVTARSVALLGTGVTTASTCTLISLCTTWTEDMLIGLQG